MTNPKTLDMITQAALCIEETAELEKGNAPEIVVILAGITDVIRKLWVKRLEQHGQKEADKFAKLFKDAIDQNIPFVKEEELDAILKKELEKIKEQRERNKELKNILKEMKEVLGEDCPEDLDEMLGE